MRQADYNRAEEFITLRDELLRLWDRAYQILHWTIFVVIVGMAWYLGKPASERIVMYAFALFLYALVGLSIGAYLVYTNQIWRIGSYLAVFWESRDNDRRMQWHRLNRRGPIGGFLPDTAILIYSGAFGLVALFVLFLTSGNQSAGEIMRNISLAMIGSIFAVWVTGLRDNLRYHRDRYEREWREIRAAEERMNTIHAAYEMVPTGVLAPTGILPAGRIANLVLALLGLAVVGLLALATLKPMLYQPPPAISLAVEERMKEIEQNFEQKLEQMEKNAQQRMDELQRQLKDISDRLPKLPPPKPPKPPTQQRRGQRR